MTIEIPQLGRKLIFYGVILFLIGLIQGAFIPNFHNSRMALSAHLAAVQSGIVMMVFGLIWGMLSLEKVLLKIAYYANILGMYLVWFAISLGAILGASRALPIAGQGFSASKVAESSVETIIVIGSVSMVVSVAFIAFGLFRGHFE